MFNLPPLPAHIIELALVALLFALATGLGLRVLLLLRAYPLLNTGERLVFGASLGMGTLGFGVFFVGLLGLMYSRVGLALLLLAMLAGYRPLLNIRRDALSAMRRAVRGLLRLRLQLQYGPVLFIALLCLMLGMVALVRAFVPVVTQDDLMYHLALPRRYIEDHRVQFYPDSNYSLFPQLMEMLYTLGMMLGGDRVPVLIALGMGMLAIAAISLLARRLPGGNEPMWRIVPGMAAALFLSSPLTLYVLRAANTDFAQSAFDLLAILSFYLATVQRDRGRHSMLALSGLCGGLAFSVKYYGLAVPLLLGVVLVVILVREHMTAARTGQHTGAYSARCIASYIVPPLLLGGVWLVRNYISSGNPVWPAAGNIFGGSYWSPAAAPEVLLGTVPGLSLNSFWTGLHYDLNAITRPYFVLDKEMQVVSLGPLLIPALLALPLARWRSGLRLALYVAASIWMVSLFYFSRASIRYLTSVFLLAALLGAYSLVSVAVRTRIGKRMIGAVVGLTLVLLTLESTLTAGPALPVVFSLSRASEPQYLANYMEDRKMMDYIASRTPITSIIYVWDSRPRGYYIPRPYIYGRLVPRYSGFSSDPVAWHARLKELGVTHVLYHYREVLAPGAGYAPGYDPDRPAFLLLQKRFFGPPLFKVDDYMLFALK